MRLLSLLLRARQRRLAKLAGVAGRCSRKRTRRRSRRKPSPMDKLTDDLLVEIFSRAPYKSLRRFPCVCKRWRDLIADPDNRRKLPQTLAGVFYRAEDLRFAYASVTGRPFFDASLAFLPHREWERLHPVDGCNGLLLCCCFRFGNPYEFDYLVINPATVSWVAVPVPRRWSIKSETVRLGFDPAVSSHFHIFEFQLDRANYSYSKRGAGHVLGVEIYSSGTGLWSYKQSNWSVEVTLYPDFNSVFVDGMLYVVTLPCLIGAVDVEGTTWRILDFPGGAPFFHTAAGFIDLSQGKLHLVNNDDMTRDNFAIWVLEDSNREEWTLKHTVRKKNIMLGFSEFDVVAIHPDRNMVFFVFGPDKILSSYDMDSGEVHMISSLGELCYDHYIPYIPLFSESLANGQQ